MGACMQKHISEWGRVYNYILKLYKYLRIIAIAISALLALKYNLIVIHAYIISTHSYEE